MLYTKGRQALPKEADTGIQDDPSVDHQSSYDSTMLTNELVHDIETHDSLLSVPPDAQREPDNPPLFDSLAYEFELVFPESLITTLPALLRQLQSLTGEVAV